MCLLSVCMVGVEMRAGGLQDDNWVGGGKRWRGEVDKDKELDWTGLGDWTG